MILFFSLSHSQDDSFQGCWHGRPLGRVIHTQNITFTKDPGQNIRGGKKFRLLMFVEVDSFLRSSHHSQPAEWKVPGNPTIKTPLSHQLPSCKSLFPLVRISPNHSPGCNFSSKRFTRLQWCLTAWREVNWWPLLLRHVVRGEMFASFKGT